MASLLGVGVRDVVVLGHREAALVDDAVELDVEDGLCAAGGDQRHCDGAGDAGSLVLILHCFFDGVDITARNHRHVVEGNGADIDVDAGGSYAASDHQSGIAGRNRGNAHLHLGQFRQDGFQRPLLDGRIAEGAAHHIDLAVVDRQINACALIETVGVVAVLLRGGGACTREILRELLLGLREYLFDLGGI